MPKKNKKTAQNSSKKVKNAGQKGIIPLADRVLIQEDTSSAEQTTASGIIIPVTVAEDKGSKRGTVVSTGPGRIEEGKRVPISVKPGDVVLFQWGDKVKAGEEEFYLVRESEILAVINK